MTVLTKRTQVGAKVETTEGTINPVAAGDLFRTTNMAVTPEIAMVARELLDSSLSTFASLSGKRQAGMTFTCEMKGAGGTANSTPEWNAALQGCGMISTDNTTDRTWTPSSVMGVTEATDAVPVSLSAYMDGLLVRLWGARGNVSFDFESGQVPKMNYTFTGADFDVTDASLLSPTYDSTTPPVVLGISMTMHGESFKISKATIDLGNELVLRDDITASSGNFSTLIGSRKVVGTLDPEAFLIASGHDIFDVFRNGTEASFTITIGTGTGQQFVVTCPKSRYTGIGFGERGIYRTFDVGFECNRNTAAGDDEISIVQT